jgi:TPR repeat protein
MNVKIRKNTFTITLTLLLSFLCLSCGGSDLEPAVEAGMEYLENRDPKTAESMFKPLVDKDNADAIYGLALCNIRKLVETNNMGYDWKAISLLEKAADAGHVNAQIIVGKRYLNGRYPIHSDLYKYVSEKIKFKSFKNEPKGFKFLMMAAEQDDDDAQYAVAECYRQAKGVEYSFIKCLIWNIKSQF